MKVSFTGNRLIATFVMVTSKRRKKICIAILCCVLLLLLPGCSLLQDTTSDDGSSLEASVTVYKPDKIEGLAVDEKMAVIAETTVDVFKEPDVRSERVTQGFYNQPVSVLDEKPGWVQVQTADGSTGWIKSKFMEKDISSIYGKTCMGKIVVTSREKAVYSQSKGGVTLKDAVMGTVFYTFNSSNEAYEVYLPGNTTGWLRGSGIIHLKLDEGIPGTTGEDFAATAQKFKGAGYLWRGLSGRGIDSCGLLYVCAKINGVSLSRLDGGQKKDGIDVSAGNPPAEDRLKVGDLLFFSTDTDNGSLSYGGIYLGGGKYIYSSKHYGYVKVDTLENKSPEGNLASVRRIFSK